jgi:imidazolonepropionase-like amidohydrolase
MDTPRLAVIAERYFDGERLHRFPHTLTVVDGVIESVAEGDFSELLELQGLPVERGDLLLPGLVDAHAHLFLDGASTDLAHRAEHLKRPLAQLTEAARQHARETAAWGVTLVRDAGDRHGINHRLREEALVPGSGMPRVRSAGSALKRPHRYGGFMGIDANAADNLVALVEERARTSDEIKLILTGTIAFDASADEEEPQFSAGEAALVVAAAHRCGRKVMAHCSSPSGLEIAVSAGVDSIEHGFFVDRAMLARMRDRDLAWTPTFCPLHYQWAHPRVARWSAAVIDTMRRILDEHAEHLRIAHELGVRLLVGTDAGSMGVQHGRAVYEEMRHFLDAGLPLEAVLRAATGAPRQHFGEPHPRLVQGGPFEAVLFHSSPFGDPRTLQRPYRVWRAPQQATTSESALAG